MMKSIIKHIFYIVGFIPFLLEAQNLTITSTGQTGTSGTNWSVNSSSDPVVITVQSGNAIINSSVIEGYFYILELDGGETYKKGFIYLKR